MTASTIETPLATHPESVKSQELTVADRCDRCNAQAFVIATKSNLMLLFCGHHGREHTPGLLAQGFDINDQTHRINEKPSVSANQG